MEKTLTKQVKDILICDWDPIGMNTQYDGYIPELLTILTQQRSIDAAEKYLLWAEQERMELKPNLAHTKAIAQKLIDLMDKRDLEKANASGSGHEALKEILLCDWDPVGINTEYDGYISRLLTILTKQRSIDAVEKYLLWAEQEHMGLKPNLAHTKAIAQKLIELMDKRDLEKANASGSKDDE